MTVATTLNECEIARMKLLKELFRYKIKEHGLRFADRWLWEEHRADYGEVVRDYMHKEFRADYPSDVFEDAADHYLHLTR